MYDPLMRGSPKVDQAMDLLEEGDIASAIKLWREAMEKRGKCVLFCEGAPESNPIHVCANCFEKCLWNTVLYSQIGVNVDQEKFNHSSLAQKLRDWLLQFTSADA